MFPISIFPETEFQKKKKQNECVPIIFLIYAILFERNRRSKIEIEKQGFPATKWDSSIPDFSPPYTKKPAAADHEYLLPAFRSISLVAAGPTEKRKRPRRIKPSASSSTGGPSIPELPEDDTARDTISACPIVPTNDSQTSRTVSSESNSPNRNRIPATNSIIVTETPKKSLNAAILLTIGWSYGRIPLPVPVQETFPLFILFESIHPK